MLFNEGNETFYLLLLSEKYNICIVTALYN